MAGLLDPSEGDGSWVENRPSKWQRTWDVLGPYVTAPYDAYRGMMNTPLDVLLGGGTQDQQDALAGQSFTTAGAAMAGGSFAPKPRNALMMGFDGSPMRENPMNPRIRMGHNNPPPDLNLQNVLGSRAQQMELPPNARIQPDPNRTRIIDTDYKTPAPFGSRPNLADNYPRNPDPNAPLPHGDRARILVDNQSRIADRLAEKIQNRGLVGTDVQYFYSSDGPIYRAAVKAGLSDAEAKKYIEDFAQHYAATSPRTDTTQNLRNATLTLAKEAGNIPHRQVVGPGTVTDGVKGISEKGYPMMTGKGGIHGGLIDAVQSGEGINSMTNPKPSTFGGNMGGNLSGVTADTHAIRGVLMALNELEPGIIPDAWIVKGHHDAYKADPQSLNPSMINDTLGSQMIGPKGGKVKAQTEYSVIADIWHKVADRLGVEPAEAQSLGWFSLGDETNLGSQLATVADLMDQRINVTAKALKNDPKDVARALFRRQIPLMAVPAGLLGGSMYSQMGSDEANAGAL